MGHSECTEPSSFVLSAPIANVGQNLGEIGPKTRANVARLCTPYAVVDSGGTYQAVQGKGGLDFYPET
jgi:hypothetical protein